MLLRRCLCTGTVHWPQAYLYRSLSTSTNSNGRWLFVDSVFPIQLGRWDLRRFIGFFREDFLLSDIRSRLSSVKTHGFEILDVKPQHKDGGIFIQFKYDNSGDLSGAMSSEIEHDILEQVRKQGLPSWMYGSTSNVWLVKGSPWLEDMDRYASNILKVSFDGPDVREQQLYQLYRPFGRIKDVTSPTPVPAGTLRSSLIMFQRISSASIARNVTHGFVIEGDGSVTRIRTAFENPIQAHIIRNWIFNHPKIVLPVILFLLGTITYTVFDPIRSFMVKAKMLGWLNYKAFKAYQWIRSNTVDRLNSSRSSLIWDEEQVWKERGEAHSSLTSYLTDLPSTVAFLHGPQGSGKSSMLDNVLKGNGRTTLVIDCKELQKAPSNARLVALLARQTGYWPTFSFLDSMNNWIDLISVGVIGQKAGLSSSLEEQLNQVLSVVGSALAGVKTLHRREIQQRAKRDGQDKGFAARWRAFKGRLSKRSEPEKETSIGEESSQIQKQESESHSQDEKSGWMALGGRLSKFTGLGQDSSVPEEGSQDRSLEEKLGLKALKERFSKGAESAKETQIQPDDSQTQSGSEEVPGERKEKKQKAAQEAQAVEALPIVVIRNFDQKAGDVLINVLAQWAASLAENQVAHVIVISDNRENSKRLAKALPSKPLNSIALYDADADSSLALVKKRLSDAGIEVNFTSKETAVVSRLGGRASDLESLIHKVRSGFSIEDAVEDIISRGVGELRKTAFGDDTEDAKSLSWSRNQAWAIMKRLAKEEELPYYDVLMDVPFKGDEGALRNMEQSELISITTNNGRPSMIRPGKPVYHYVFKRLAEDNVFRATLDIQYNNQTISTAETTIHACEEELKTLQHIDDGERSRWFGGKSVTAARGRYLLDKISAAGQKIEACEKQNAELKKVLSKKGVH